MPSALRLHSSLLNHIANVIVTTGYWKVHDEGTPGYSDTRADIGMVQMLMPAKGGTLTIRSDTVRYDLGSPLYTSDAADDLLYVIIGTARVSRKESTNGENNLT